MRVLRIFHSAVVDAWRERERQLRALGADVDLLTARRWNEGGTDVALVARLGEPVTGLRTWGRHPALFVYAPLPLWRALGRSYDVMDIQEEPFALATAEILLLRRLRRQRAPYVLYSAQNIDKRYPPPFRWLERWALRHAAALSVCNSEAGRICERKGFPGAATLIPLGVDTQRFTPASERPAGRVPVIGYVGRLEPHKGVHVLLEAIARLDRATLRIAGAGPEEAALHARVAELRIGDRVELVGSVGQDQLPDFYRGLDVLAVPSLPTPGWLEQFGRVVVEAMACGVPVVASDTGALPDVVGDAGLLVPPGDPEALATALESVLEDDATRGELSRRGVEQAQQASWSEVAGDYLGLYGLAAGTTADPRRGLEIVVVAYGRPDLLEASLQPVLSFPVIVVDNSSSPDVAAVCERLGVRYLDPGHNGGFAAGVNHALDRRLDPDADVLLLNPDAVIARDDVLRLHEALLADPALASVAPTQVDELDHPSRVSWPFPSPSRTLLTAAGLGRLGASSGFVIGSVLMLRREALAQVGRFDDAFFLYAEETDWAYRAHQLGWRHREVTEAQAVHLGAATSADPARRETHFHASQERYLRKHFGPLGWQLARGATILGSAARGLVLAGDRGREARARAALYVTGPLEAEASLPASRPAGEGGRDMPVSLSDVLRVSGLAMLWLAGALAVVGIGYFIPTRPEISLALGVLICLFGMTLMDSAIIPLLLVVPILVSYRVALGGVDLTFSDAALFFAFFPAAIFAQRPYTPAMRSLIWCGVIYEVLTLFTVIANPYRANAIEWVHAGLLTVGALVVGWSIGREGHARLGLTLILLACSGLAVSVVVQGLTQYGDSNFSGVFPRWPYDMHKNFAGCLFGIAAAVAYARPSWVRWPPLFAQACFWICLVGLAMTQSRQAMAGLAAALIVIVMRTHNSGRERRSKVILLAVAAGLGFILVMVRDQVASGNEFNSFFQRVDWFGESVRIWQTNPLFGVGLRWWYTDRFETKFQPPNAVLEMLSTAGLVGLVGFLVLMVGSLVVLWRMDPRYGLVAFVVILSRLVQGQLDLFWVAVQTSIPFLIVGICLGAHGRELAEQPPGVGQATEHTPDDAQAPDKATV